MSVKNLGLVVVCHQPYIRKTVADGEIPRPENDIFFTSVSKTYLPLVELLHKIEEQNIRAKFSVVLTPTVCAMLDDRLLQEQYVAWLDRQIALGESEMLRLKNQSGLLSNAAEILAETKKNRTDFFEKYNCSLLREFAHFNSAGIIEIIGSTGTYAFLPHYSDMTEVLNAQVETGILSHKKYFGSAPDGLWLPYMGFAPGIERVLRSYGINYTLLDSSSFLFAENSPSAGIFAPVRSWNSLVYFARDSKASLLIEDGESGYFRNSVYKNCEKDIGFELPSNDLKAFLPETSPRSQTLFRYWANGADGNAVYDREKALEKARFDAKNFLKCENEKLEKASVALGGTATVMCTVDADFLGKVWDEGMTFFETLLTENTDSNFILPCELLGNQFHLERMQPYPSAASGTGYGEDLLDSSNSWMLRYNRKMCERMVDLAGRFPAETGLKERLLNLGAKELMIAQSAELAKMLHEGIMSEFAKESFSAGVFAFTTVFDSLGTNLVSTEWLTKLEKEHTLFPWMNYKIFAKKI